MAKDGDNLYQLNPDPSGEARRQLFGVPVYVTPFLSDAAIVADMSQIGVGVRDRVTLFYDSSRYAEYDQSLIRLTARFDIAVLNPEGVELLTDITINVRRPMVSGAPARLSLKRCVQRCVASATRIDGALAEAKVQSASAPARLSTRCPREQPLSISAAFACTALDGLASFEHLGRLHRVAVSVNEITAQIGCPFSLSPG